MEYSGQYWPQIEAAAAAHQIDPTMFFNLLAHESMFNPNAVSPAGAQGIAQFMPGTAEGLGINPLNPDEAIPAAAQYIRQLLDMNDGRYEHAFAGYNAGQGNVRKYGGVPPFKETEALVGDLSQGIFPKDLTFAPGWRERIAAHPVPVMTSGAPPMNTLDMQGPLLENVSGIAEQEFMQMAKDAIPAAPLEAVPETARAMNPFTNPEVLGATKYVPPAGIMQQAGQNLMSPLGIAGALATLGMTDWEDPESIGSSVGGLAGGALGAPAASALAAGAGGAASGAAAGAAAGSVVPVVGTVVGGIAGSLLGGEVGKLFGGKDKEEEAKKEQKYAFLNESMSSMAKQNAHYGQERRQAIDRVTDYVNQTNQKRPYQWAL